MATQESLVPHARARPSAALSISIPEESDSQLHMLNLLRVENKYSFLASTKRMRPAKDRVAEDMRYPPEAVQVRPRLDCHMQVVCIGLAPTCHLREFYVLIPLRQLCGHCNLANGSGP